MVLDEQREILFRGREVFENRWIEGCVVLDIFYPHYAIKEEGKFLYQVYPKTIGQYTGFKDCNGKKIFERDIIYCKTYPHLMRDNLEKLLDGIPKEVTGQVVMHKGAWVVKNSREMYFPLGDVYSVKVLGNVFDDFELLDGKNCS